MCEREREREYVCERDIAKKPKVFSFLAISLIYMYTVTEKACTCILYTQELLLVPHNRFWNKV